MLQRVFRNIAALGVGQAIHIATQLAIPPIFIAVYGIDGFAYWLLLTAATAHLNTLDFGLQTYIVNELTMLHHRGEHRRFHEIQSVGLWLSLALVTLGTLLAALVFVLPLAKWAGFQDSLATKSTIFFLAIQVVGLIVFGQFAGLYRVIGEAQQGVYWQNWQRGLSLVLTLSLAGIGAPFWQIACVQAGCALAVLGALITRLRRRHADIFPWPRYWNQSDARVILRQSAFFGLFGLNQLLVFHVPVLQLNRFATPTMVVAYSISRTLFSFMRQLSNLVLAALAPELTRLMGMGDRTGLARAYRCSEAITYTTALIGSVAIFLAAPWLLKYWLGKPELFSPATFWLMMLASVALLVKESKLYLQHATNEHVPTAISTSASYAAMLLCSVPAILRWGVNGLIVVWLAAELVQIFLLHRFNRQLMQDRAEPAVAPLAKFLAAAAVVAGALWAFQPLLRTGGFALQALKALAVVTALAVASCIIFDLRSLLRHPYIAAMVRPLPKLRTYL